MRRQSYMLVVVQQLHPLRDPGGTAYPWVPCMSVPIAWDEIAPVSVRRRAAEICRMECPALTECEHRRAELSALAEAGHCQPPRGVWAGQIVTGRGDHELAPVPSGAGRRQAHRLPPLPPETLRLVG